MKSRTALRGHFISICVRDGDKETLWIYQAKGLVVSTGIRGDGKPQDPKLTPRCHFPSGAALFRDIPTFLVKRIVIGHHLDQEHNFQHQKIRNTAANNLFFEVSSENSTEGSSEVDRNPNKDSNWDQYTSCQWHMEIEPYNVEYSVSPLELDLRLREILEEQQQERIQELEALLTQTEAKLHAKEQEVLHWKNHVNSLTTSLQACGKPNICLEGSMDLAKAVSEPFIRWHVQVGGTITPKLNAMKEIEVDTPIHQKYDVMSPQVSELSDCLFPDEWSIDIVPSHWNSNNSMSRDTSMDQVHPQNDLDCKGNGYKNDNGDQIMHVSNKKSQPGGQRPHQAPKRSLKFKGGNLQIMTKGLRKSLSIPENSPDSTKSPVLDKIRHFETLGGARGGVDACAGGHF